MPRELGLNPPPGVSDGGDLAHHEFVRWPTMVTACTVGPGHRLAQRTMLALLLAHGDLPMDSREAMLTNV
jgi:hypothetical protein